MHALWRMAGVGVLLACSTVALGAAAATVTVDYTKPKQTIAGFGASIAWVAIDLKNFSAADQTTILDALYSTSKPSAGLSVVRADSMLCEFNPSPGVYDWNHVLIQDEMSWMNRGCRTPAPRWARK